MPKKDVTKKEKKEKKHFFKDFKAELKRVIWPTPKQLVNNTVAVIVIVLITAVIVFLLDLVFEFGNRLVTNQVKNLVHSHNEETENTNTNEQAENAVDNILNNEAENNTINE